MPTSLSTARMVAARSHYPPNFRTTQAIPYRQVISTNSQIYKRKISSKYRFAQVADSKFEREGWQSFLAIPNRVVEKFLIATCYLLSATYYLVDWLFPTYYEYAISASFTRQHCNPPIWHDNHSHDFCVTLILSAPKRDRDLYGVDIVEAETILNSAIAQMPKSINDLPGCQNGTTEQLCNYFARTVKFSDRACKIKSVSVSETPERITKSEVRSRKSEVKKFLLVVYYLLPITYYLWCLNV